MRKRRIIGSTAVLAALTGAVFQIASPKAPAQTAPAQTLPVVSTVVATGYQLVNEARVSRTVYDLTYRVTVRNTGRALIEVAGRASSTSTVVTFPDNAASFVDIAANAPATSTDTITVRHDRTKPFTTGQLAWEFRAWPTTTLDGTGIAISYPPTWAVETSAEERITRLEGQVTSTISQTPGDLGGLCKIVIRRNENTASLPLDVWIRQLREDSGAPLPTSSTLRDVAGLQGIQEVTEGIGVTKTVFLAHSGAQVTSFQLLCGDEAFSDGERIFDVILRAITFM